MSGILFELLTNRYVLLVLAALGAVAGVYFKGRAAGVSAVKADEQAAKDALNNDIRKSESKNQDVEKEKNNAVQNVDNASDSESVTKLLNSQQSKSPNDSSSK